jgi:hypothetical protein
MNPIAELVYDVAALTLVGLFASWFFWGFIAVVGTSVLISLALMAVERTLT